jgi:hypothetical protein
MSNSSKVKRVAHLMAFHGHCFYCPLAAPTCVFWDVRFAGLKWPLQPIGLHDALAVLQNL